MPVELHRTLFIGLGGAGIKTILKTKSMFLERFGEVPPCVGFLGIDTDALEFAASAQEYGVSLDAHEAVAIGGPNTDDLYRANQDAFSWMPKRNIPHLPQLKDLPEYFPLRSTGRFIFELNRFNIQCAINKAVNKVMAATSDGGYNWDLINSPIQVYVVFSMSGATGGGIFLNLGYMLREMFYDRCCLYAYAVLPGVFSDCGHYVGANAYGAALDMDFLMSNVDSEHPYETSTMDGIKRYITKPYDLFYCIDNVNVFGKRYSREQLYSVLGRAFVNRTSNLGMHISSDTNIYRLFIAEGGFDIEDKTSWVMGQGYCEITIDYEKLFLSDFLRLTSSLLNGEASCDCDGTVNSWLRKYKLSCSELTTGLYDFTHHPKAVIHSIGRSQVRNEAENIIASAKNEIGHRTHCAFHKILCEVYDALPIALSEIISSFGIIAAGDFLESLEERIKEEESLLNNILKQENRNHEVLHYELMQILDSWPILFPRESVRISLEIHLGRYLKNLAERCSLDKAAQLYLELEGILCEWKEKAASARTELSKICNQQHEEYDGTISGTSSDHVIDITSYVTPNHLKGSENVVKDFFAWFSNGAVSLLGMGYDDMRQLLTDFATSRKQYNYDAISVEDVLLSLDSTTRNDILERANRISKIMFEHQYVGYPSHPRKMVYMLTKGGWNSELARCASVDSFFCGSAGGLFVPLIGRKLTVYVHGGPYPVFQVANIMAQRQCYEMMSERFSFSIDASIEQKINDDNFGFLPNQRRDDDVLEMWVKGLIHGFIKKDGQKYLVQSKALSKDDKTNDYWFELRSPEEGMGTEARYYAFEDFKSKKRDLKRKGDLLERIREEEMRMGKDAIVKLYTEVKEATAEEYVSKYSYANIELKTINGSASYKKTRDVIKDELSYCEDTLLKSLNM